MHHIKTQIQRETMLFNKENGQTKKSIAGKTEKFNGSDFSIDAIFFIDAGESQQVGPGIPSHSIGRCFNRDAQDALSAGNMTDVNQQIFRSRGQHGSIVAEA